MYLCDEREDLLLSFVSNQRTRFHASKKQQAQVGYLFCWAILHFHKAYEFIIHSGMQIIVGAYEYYKPNARGLKI